MFIKHSSYSNLITHMFVISVYVVHFITPFINRPSTWCFLSNQVLYLFKFHPHGKMENFIQSDCFCRYTTVAVVPSINRWQFGYWEFRGCVQKLRSRITGEVLIILSEITEFYWHPWNPYKLFLELLFKIRIFFVIFPRPFLL